MRIALVSDAWAPQVNGVVRTLTEVVARIRRMGHEVATITPGQFATIACPGYAEIRLALFPYHRMAKLLRAATPEIVHIATEGPLGWAARRWCRRNRIPFTTAFHTRFPDYLAARTGLSADWFWPAMRRFHAGARATLAATPSLVAELEGRGFGNVRLWSRGVDLAAFGQPFPRPPELANLPRPIMLYVGRIAVEKGLPDFLGLSLPGTKLVVGDGPALGHYAEQYRDAKFLGALHGERLVEAYKAADIFVFPSKTDTFGLVVIEALASGLPVAAYPAQGPLDILGIDGRGGLERVEGPAGALDENLADAIARAGACRREDCIALAQHFDWDQCAAQFLDAMRGAAAEGEGDRRAETSMMMQAA